MPSTKKNLARMQKKLSNRPKKKLSKKKIKVVGMFGSKSLNTKFNKFIAKFEDIIKDKEELTDTQKNQMNKIIAEYYNTTQVYTKKQMLNIVDDIKREFIKQYATIHNQLNVEINDCNEKLKQFITPQGTRQWHGKPLTSHVNLKKENETLYPTVSPNKKSSSNNSLEGFDFIDV